MTRVRALDINGDWTFGKGQNDYLTANLAIAQNIKTRLSSFLGNCFFDLGAGVDWLNLLGSQNVLALRLSVAGVILNTPDVTGILQLSVNLDPRTRALTASYEVQTTYSQTGGSFQYDQNGIS